MKEPESRPTPTEAAEAWRQQQAIDGASSPSPCPARRVDYGDFTEFQVRMMVADYGRDITLGFCGWGVPFTVWVELKGLAKHDKMHRLISQQND